MTNKKLSEKQAAEIIEILKNRFDENINRHKDIEWHELLAKLDSNPAKLWSLYEMERTGGEPDLIAFDKNSGIYTFYDCSQESPKGRRSLCYDREALESRKEHKPEGSAIEMAQEMGIELLDEDEYRQLQTMGEFDLKTSSWIKTPAAIRKLGGALFADRRYDYVFVYHNGAPSYYAARAFRGSLKI